MPFVLFARFISGTVTWEDEHCATILGFYLPCVLDFCGPPLHLRESQSDMIDPGTVLVWPIT